YLHHRDLPSFPTRRSSDLSDASDDHLLVAYDWSAHIAGTMRVNASEPFGVTQSPDGTRLVLTHATPANGGTLVGPTSGYGTWARSEEHTSELQSPYDLVCR